MRTASILTGRKILASVTAFLFTLELFSQGLWFSLLAGVAPGDFHEHPNLSDARPEIEDYVVVVTMGKGEGKYLREWVEHNRRVGVDKVIYYDDTPKGEKDASKSILETDVASGFLEFYDATKWDNRSFVFATDYTIAQTRGGSKLLKVLSYDKQQKMQVDIWRRFRKQDNASRHTWIAQLDVDEFYNIGKDDNVKLTLRKARLKGAKSVRIAKVEFGPSGHLRPTATIRDEYILRERQFERHTGFALAWAVTGMAPGCPHVYVTNSLLADAIRGSHECNSWYGDAHSGQIRYEVYYAPTNELSAHHYNTKSMEECYIRSEVPHPDGNVVNRHCTSGKYDFCDDSILRFVDGYRNGSKAMPCAGEGGNKTLYLANKLRMEMLRNDHKDIVDICAKRSISEAERIACGFQKPDSSFVGFVPDLPPDHVYKH